MAFLIWITIGWFTLLLPTAVSSALLVWAIDLVWPRC